MILYGSGVPPQQLFPQQPPMEPYFEVVWYVYAKHYELCQQCGCVLEDNSEKVLSISHVTDPRLTPCIGKQQRGVIQFLCQRSQTNTYVHTFPKRSVLHT